MENTYRNLKSLADSNYQIIDGEPHIIGWKVNSESNIYLGEVKDLLFDPETNAVRYLIIDLSGNGMGLEGKNVMIPIGIANLHENENEVILPNVRIDQFNALPNYDYTNIGPKTEVEIREIIGSPAALRIEEAISEFDQNQFYTHHHFDKGKFYQRERSNENLASQEISGTASMSDRVAEETTIHELIENSSILENNAAQQEHKVIAHHNEHIKSKLWLQKDYLQVSSQSDNEHNEILTRNSLPDHF